MSHSIRRPIRRLDQNHSDNPVRSLPRARTVQSLILFALSLTPSLIVSGCHRVSLNQEMDAAVATTRWLDRKVGFEEDPALNSVARRVTARLKDAIYKTALERDLSGDDADDYKEYPWQVFILKTDKPNAFNSGAGVVYISRGLIRELGTEAELAAVISHEMAHELLGHTREAFEARAAKDSPEFAFTVEHEIAADALGLKILSVARYSPSAALNAITDTNRARALAGDVTLDDSALRQRLANLKQEMDEMIPPYPATDNTREYAQARAAMKTTP